MFGPTCMGSWAKARLTARLTTSRAVPTIRRHVDWIIIHLLPLRGECLECLTSDGQTYHARDERPPEAGAGHERTLEGVGSNTPCPDGQSPRQKQGRPGV